MPQISGRILYVNPPKPGARSGSIKLDNNERIGIPANMLDQFQRGQPVTLEYTDREYQGRWYKDIVVNTGTGNGTGYAPPSPNTPVPSYRPAPPQQVSRPAAPRPPAPPQQAPRPQQGGHDYNTGKQICITGVSQRAIQSGKFDITDLPTIMRIVADTYDEIFGLKPATTPAPPVYQNRGQPAGPRDEIPAFDDRVDDIGYDPESPPY